MLAGDEPATLRLIKLHGSLNWMYSGDRGGYGDALYDTLQIGQWGTRTRTTFEQVRNTAPGLEVALLAPTPTKVGMMSNGMLRHLWVTAADAIAAADRIVLIGYSIPASDRIVRAMLSVVGTAVGESEPAKVLLPVDIATTIADTLAELLPDAEVCRDFCGMPNAFHRFVADYVS